MRLIHLLALLALAAGLCVGCGGGGNPNLPGEGSASATITIEWPQPERLIPLAANSIKVDISDTTGFAATQTVDRPAPPATTSTIHFDPVPVGNLTITATAYPQAGATGTPQATGSTTVTTLGGQNVSIGLTMASTIDRLEIAPSSPLVGPGATVQLTATPRNAAGQVVLTAPGNITWSSANPAVASVDASGLVTGVSQGSAQITATESESGKTASVTVTVATGPVQFSGPISGSVTWSGRYRLTGDVTIPIGATLTIQPGTVVESMRRQDDQLGGLHLSRVEIIVNNGTLIAEGTEASPILFTSWDQVELQAKEDWYGLRLNSGTSRLRYCTVEYGIEGVRIEGGTPTVEYCTIQHNRDRGVRLEVSATLNALTVTDSSTGVSLADGRALTLSNSTVSNNGGSGVYAGNSATVNVTGSTISNNGSGVSGDGFGSGTFTVTASTISSNWGAGVLANYGTVTIIGSTISNNGGDVPYAGASAETVTVTSSTISNNSGDGVRASYYSSSWYGYNLYYGSASVTNSSIVGNGGSGLVLANLGAEGMSGNLLHGNRFGVWVVSSAAVLTLPAGNDIFGNTEYELRNATSNAVSANGNYWGEPTTTELNSAVTNLTKIWDSRDDANVGQVVITQWSPTRFTAFPLP